MLEDENPGIRLKALDALRAHTNNPDVRQALVRVLRQDDNPGMRVHAIDLLAEKLCALPHDFQIVALAGATVTASVAAANAARIQPMETPSLERAPGGVPILTDPPRGCNRIVSAPRNPGQGRIRGSEVPDRRYRSTTAFRVSDSSPASRR